ncbi:hypothetical protein ACIRG5_06085 [Lentzea sp. NPDC102401]|uniref:hypothetical protein n=1 Tax=Lentzea sp. NPDC102401 TaxID=3364128 RepID=UPI0037F7BB15
MPLDELQGANVVANREALRDAGATGAAVSDEPAVVTAAGLLRLAQDREEAITSVVYTTENFEGSAPSDLIGRLMHLSGRELTPACAVTGNGCANLGFALLNAAEQCRRTGPVAVVSADRAHPDVRVLTDSMSLLGDAVGVCTVTAGPPADPGFQLAALRTTASSGPPVSCSTPRGGRHRTWRECWSARTSSGHGDFSHTRPGSRASRAGRHGRTLPFHRCAARSG